MWVWDALWKDKYSLFVCGYQMDSDPLPLIVCSQMDSDPPPASYNNMQLDGQWPPSPTPDSYNRMQLDGQWTLSSLPLL